MDHLHADDTSLLPMRTALEKERAYEVLTQQVDSLFQDEHDWLANTCQFTALIASQVPALNWVGFYRALGEELVLGPFQGKIACTRIPFSRGVCGACASSGEVQCVADVHARPEHISCDGNSRSELVLPIFINGKLWGVLDLDSPVVDRFDAQDVAGFSRLVVGLIAGTRIDGS